MEDFRDTRWETDIVNDGENTDNDDTLMFERSRIKALAGWFFGSKPPFFNTLLLLFDYHNHNHNHIAS